MIVYFDSLHLNKDSGGVLQFSDSLCLGMEELGVELKKSMDFLPGLKRCGRFIHESVVAYNLRDLNTRCIFPNYFLPPTLNKQISARSLVVIHDFQYKYFPEYFSKSKVRWLNFCLNRVHLAAGAVVCISASTKDDYIKFLGNRENLYVINNPVSIGDDNSFEYVDGIVSRYMIANCHFYPHKNFEGIIELFLKMRCAGYDGSLLLTGGGRERFLDFARAIPDFPVQDIKHLGFLSTQKLRMLQKNADAMISLSRFEGFNLPAAECAIFGVPLILSDIPVHRELFPNSFFVNEYLNDLPKLLKQILHYKVVRKRNFDLEERFSIKNVAQMYLNVLSALS